MQKKNQFYKTVSHAPNSITRDQETVLHDHSDIDVNVKSTKCSKRLWILKKKREIINTMQHENLM